jgi:hypothetical protein
MDLEVAIAVQMPRKNTNIMFSENAACRNSAR